MGLLELLIVFAVLGFCAWLVLTYVPMPSPMKQVLVVLLVIGLLVFVLQLFGVGDIHIGR